jgi:hypothetical protein
MLMYAISVVMAIAAVIVIAKVCECIGDWE